MALHLLRVYQSSEQAHSLDSPTSYFKLVFSSNIDDQPQTPALHIETGAKDSMAQLVDNA
eukprot:m.886603 g.886603  ORF g.886603 m.886603 type:complete len:60 (+) comp23626_c1_seq5:4019-4198(+)